MPVKAVCVLNGEQVKGTIYFEQQVNHYYICQAMLTLYVFLSWFELIYCLSLLSFIILFFVVPGFSWVDLRFLFLKERVAKLM